VYAVSKKVFSFRNEVIACLKVMARLYPDEVMEAAVLPRLQWNAGNEHYNIVSKVSKAIPVTGRGGL
jgi:hypothetical protein